MFSLISTVVEAGDVNFTHVPYYLQQQLMLPSLYSARLLVVIVIVLITVICTMAISDNIIAVTMVIVLDLFFCTSIGWLDGWVIVLLTMLIAGLWTIGLADDLFGGG
jgi:hypothetical protein